MAKISDTRTFYIFIATIFCVFINTTMVWSDAEADALWDKFPGVGSDQSKNQKIQNARLGSPKIQNARQGPGHPSPTFWSKLTGNNSICPKNMEQL